jgi:hypothetical protein
VVEEEGMERERDSLQCFFMFIFLFFNYFLYRGDEKIAQLLVQVNKEDRDGRGKATRKNLIFLRLRLLYVI